MNVEFLTTQSEHSLPVYLIKENEPLSEQPWFGQRERNWLEGQRFIGSLGQFALLPDDRGRVSAGVFGVGDGKNPFVTGSLAKLLPEGHWHLCGTFGNIELLAIAMGSYRFDRFISADRTKSLKVFCPQSCDAHEIMRLYRSVRRARDMINMPANEMSPRDIEASVHSLALQYNVPVYSVIGDDLLAKNFPLVHAVGRAATIAPRLIEFYWGAEDAYKVTLVGKGVSFDSGGLDIKPSGPMSLMKKDMGGAANVLALAELIMNARLNVRLRVIIPAVENAVGSDAFRPGDIIRSRKGLSIEVGNTDAEGRLILADALAYADSEEPDLLVDMATLTGAARVALGPEVSPFYTDDDQFAGELARSAAEVYDPLWRLPLWRSYMENLRSAVADLNNVTKDSFAGSITAALFLSRFVDKAKIWAHFDIYGWTASERAGFPIGGEAQAIRALYQYLKVKFS